MSLLDFEFPELISADKDTPQFFQVKAFFSDFEPGWNDDLFLINFELPKQEEILTEEKLVEKEKADQISSNTSSSLVSAIVFNVLTSGAMA